VKGANTAVESKKKARYRPMVRWVDHASESLSSNGGQGGYKSQKGH